MCWCLSIIELKNARWNTETDCPCFKWLDSCSRSGGIPLLWCHKLSPFCPAMFQLISHFYKNCHVRSDDSGLNFCLKTIIMCPQLVPLCCIHLHVIDITWYCLTHYSHRHTIFCYFPWIVHPKFQATLRWGHGFTKRQFLLWITNWPAFQSKINSVENTHTKAKFWISPSAFWVCWLVLLPELYSSLLSSSYCTCFTLPSKN